MFGKFYRALGEFAGIEEKVSACQVSFSCRQKPEVYNMENPVYKNDGVGPCVRCLLFLEQPNV